MNELQQRFYSLTPRERVMLGAGTLGAVLILVYAFVWQPWQDELERLRNQVPVKQETLAWMRKQAGVIGALKQRATASAPGSDRPLLTLVEQSARQSKVDQYIRRMTPGEENQVKVWLTDADFDQWVIWLERLRTLGVEVNAATVNRTAEDKVTIRVTLQR